MKNNWAKVALGNICSLINGRAFKPSDWSDDGLPIIRIQNLNSIDKPFNRFNGKVAKRHLVQNSAILISWSGTPGTSFGCHRWNRGDAVLNQHIFKVDIDDSQIDGDFFIFAVNSLLHEMIAEAHGGVGLRHITKGKLEAIQIPVPPLPEQRRIVARIKECMERVEEIERLRKETSFEASKLTPALYEAIGKGANQQYLSVNDLILGSSNGRSIRQTNEHANGEILSLRSVHSVNLNFKETKPIILSEIIANKYSIDEGDVFVSRSNTRDLVGLSSVATQSINNLIYPDLLIKLEVDRMKIIPRFLAYSLRTAEARKQIIERAVGTSQSMVKISGKRLREIKIPVPDLEKQKETVARLDEVSGVISSVQKEFNSTPVSQLRDAILRKAFAGEF